MRSARARLENERAAECAAEAAASPNAEVRSAAECAFRFDLIDRFAAGKLEAIDLATIAFLATAAGAGGVADLAVDPESKGQNHATRIRKALGTTIATSAKDIEEEPRCDPEESEAEQGEEDEESEAELDFFDDEEVEPSPVEHAISEHEAFLNQYVDVAEV